MPKNGEIEALLDCLERLESSGNPRAYNPIDRNGPAYGLFQFHYDTFVEWCVGKYGFPEDIWDGQIQRDCARMMILAGQSWRWPPIKNCQ